MDFEGFAKEQLKVTYVHTSRMIRVSGERQVADRRWSRFNEVFTVPQNCLVDKIHGSFKNNVLTLTMPKETVTKTAHHPEASKTVAEKVKKLEEKRLLEETRRKEKEEEAEKKKKKLLEEKEELIKKLQEEAKAKEMARERMLQEEAKLKKMAEEKKLHEEATKTKEKAEARKLEEEAKLKEKAKEKKLVEEATLEKKIKESKLVDETGGKDKILKQEERKLPEVVYTKSGPVSGTKPGLGSGTESGQGSETKPGLGSGGVGEVVKAAEEKLGYLVKKENKIGKGVMEKIRGKEITSEEKKLMVNVGVAALVIFALGAYVSYTFCSSSFSSSSSSFPSSPPSSTKPE